jgi:hypothetical protein
MDVPQRQLPVALDFASGTKVACPRCGQLCAVHGTPEKEWRASMIWREPSKRHRDGGWSYMETTLTNGLMEAVNGLLQLAKRIARGFRNFHYFRLAALLKAGGLNLQTPRLLAT